MALPLDTVLNGVALVLLSTIILGLVRIWRGPALPDRMLAAQLFSSTGIALLLVLGELQDLSALRNVALILALLAVLATVAFVARVWRADRRTAGDHPSGPSSINEGAEE